MADDLESAVARHYGRKGLKERILAGISAAGLDPERLKPEDLAPVDEFHTGGRQETEHALTKIRLVRDDHVLDVGCGIGGTTRYLAAAIGCRVTGIDLTPEYIEIAQMLSTRSGLGDRTEFRTASALDLPFEDARFNAALTFHVAMNILDRPRLYAEIARVLRPGGILCIYDVLKGRGEGLAFPVPWAETAATSFLKTLDEMYALLDAARFRVTEIDDRTDFAIAFFRKRLAAGGGTPPPLGLHLLTGANSREKFQNYLAGLEGGHVAPTMIVATRV